MDDTVIPAPPYSSTEDHLKHENELMSAYIDTSVVRNHSNKRRQRDRSRSRSPGASREKRRGGEKNPGNNIYVRGLNTRANDRDLEAEFAKFGRVTSAAVVYDPHTHASRGFGFVTMEIVDDADRAIMNLNVSEFMGQLLSVGKARRKRPHTPTPGRYSGPPRPLEERKRSHDYHAYDSRYERTYRDGPYREDPRYTSRYDDRHNRRHEDTRDRRYESDLRYEEFRRYEERPPRDIYHYYARDHRDEHRYEERYEERARY